MKEESAMTGKNMQIHFKTPLYSHNRQEISVADTCLRIQDLGSEFQQPKTKVPARN